MSRRDFWYPIARASRVRRAVLARAVLGEHLAVFRDERAQVCVLGARCPHRGGNLARGRVTGGCVQCPYHGWQFDGDGRCAHIPSLGPDGAIPPRAKVRSYPVIERHGLVWTCVGDAARAPCGPPALGDLADPAMRAFTIERRVRGPADWWIENAIDFSHVPFVHGSLYSRQDRVCRGYELERWPGDLGFTATTRIRQRASLLGRLTHGSGAAVDMPVRIEHHVPCTTLLAMHLGGGRRQYLYFFMTPESDTHTRVFQIVARDYLHVPGVDTVARAIAHWVLAEDDRAVGNAFGALTGAAEHAVSVPADTATLEYRRLLRRWAF